MNLWCLCPAHDLKFAGLILAHGSFLVRGPPQNYIIYSYLVQGDYSITFLILMLTQFNFIMAQTLVF